jgi:FMN reductase
MLRPRLELDGEDGLGGSLRVSSRSRAALAVALEGAAAAGATIELLDLRRLELPMFNPDDEAEAPATVRTMVETCYEADGLLWSSPMYNGSVSGAFKNAIDWLHMLGSRDPAYRALSARGRCPTRSPSPE